MIQGATKAMVLQKLRRHRIALHSGGTRHIFQVGLKIAVATNNNHTSGGDVGGCDGSGDRRRWEARGELRDSGSREGTVSDWDLALGEQQAELHPISFHLLHKIDAHFFLKFVASGGVGGTLIPLALLGTTTLATGF